MNKLATISQKIKAELPFLKEKFHVKRMGIFGSYARNESNKGSDIDILVEFFEPIGFFDFIRLEMYLSKILKKKVDLVTEKALKPATKPYIFKDLIYA
jgi:hypothetical protein